MKTVLKPLTLSICYHSELKKIKWDNLVNITMFKCRMQVLVKDIMEVRVTMITVGKRKEARNVDFYLYLENPVGIKLRVLPMGRCVDV